MKGTSVTRIRDLTILTVGHHRLIIACDSVGGIGPKPDDTYSAPAWTSAHFATRVPLLELLCAGARPRVVVDTLCVESDPTGAEMISAVRELAGDAGVPAEAVTGSTEENVMTTATGVGVTVIGVQDDEAHTCPGASLPGDVILCLGLPRSAPEHRVYIGHPDLVTIADMVRVFVSGLLHDALPVGSKGVLHESAQLATTAGLNIEYEATRGVDLHASGGPSSCVLLTCTAEDVAAVRELLPKDLPVNVIGTVTTP